jgi:hypothetical protein
VPEMFHASQTELKTGTILESRFFTPEYEYRLHAAQSALEEGPEVMKALLLAAFVQERGLRSPLGFPMAEAIYQSVRECKFADRPSRLQSIFLSPSQDEAAKFRDHLATNKDDLRPFLYRCEVASDDYFTADVSYVGGLNNLYPIKEQIEFLTIKAELYWHGHRSEAPVTEVLAAPGTVTVVKKVDW